jgi:hypothetical protein
MHEPPVTGTDRLNAEQLPAASIAQTASMVMPHARQRRRAARGRADLPRGERRARATI